MQIKTSYNGEPFVYIIPNENPLSCFYLEKEKNGMYALYIGHMSIKYLQRVCIRKEYYKQKANTLFRVAKLRHLFGFTKYFPCQFCVK